MRTGRACWTFIKGHSRFSNLLTYLWICFYYKADAFISQSHSYIICRPWNDIVLVYIHIQARKGIIYFVVEYISNFLFELIQAHQFCFSFGDNRLEKYFFFFKHLSLFGIDYYFVIKVIHICIFCLLFDNNKFVVPTWEFEVIRWSFLLIFVCFTSYLR